jgi:hypothetical protein
VFWISRVHVSSAHRNRIRDRYRNRYFDNIDIDDDYEYDSVVALLMHLFLGRKIGLQIHLLVLEAELFANAVAIGFYGAG